MATKELTRCGILSIAFVICSVSAVSSTYTPMTSHCVQLTATATPQEFTSLGNYPQQYENYADDCWVITANSNDKFVELTVIDSRIEALLFVRCTHIDYLEVRDGNGLGSPIVLRWCGIGIPPSSPFISSGNQLYVHFHSDYSIKRGGFKMEYKSISAGEAAGLPHPNFDNEDREDEHETTDPDPGVDWRLRHKNDWHNDNEKLHKGVLAASVIGSIILLLLIAFGVCFLTKFYKSSQRSRANESTGVTDANRARDITTTSMMRGPVVITGGATGGIVNHVMIPESPSQKRRLPPAYSSVSEPAYRVPDTNIDNTMRENQRNNQNDRSRQRRPSDVLTTTMMPRGEAANDISPVGHGNASLPPVTNCSEDTTSGQRRSSLPPINPNGGTQLASRFGDANALPPMRSDSEDYAPPPTPEFPGPMSPPPPYSANYSV